MNKRQFECEIIKAKTMKSENPDYWMGYRRGINRRYHGEKFGTDEEHELYMSMHEDIHRYRSDRGKGYRDGFIPDYCTQNEGDCETCSLVSYGRDCQNEPI